MVFTAMLRSIIRNGSLCVIDSAGRRQTIGDGSPPEATLRLTSKASEYTLALNPALSLGEAYMVIVCISQINGTEEQDVARQFLQFPALAAGRCLTHRPRLGRAGPVTSSV
jgi:hypothetical protein